MCEHLCVFICVSVSICSVIPESVYVVSVYICKGCVCVCASYTRAFVYACVDAYSLYVYLVVDVNVPTCMRVRLCHCARVYSFIGFSVGWVVCLFASVRPCALFWRTIFHSSFSSEC